MRPVLCWLLLAAVAAAASVAAASASPITQQFAAAAASRGAATTLVAPAAADVGVPQQPSMLARALQSVQNQATQFKTINTANAFDAIVHDVFPESQRAAFSRLTRQEQHPSNDADDSLPGLRLPTRRQSKIVVSDFNLTPAQKAAVEAAFFTDPKSLAMRNQSPRFGPSEPKFSASGQEQKDPYGVGISAYLWGLIMCFLIGFVIGFLQLFFTGFYMFCRCCCWRWCCKKRSDWEKPGFAGYPTFLRKYWPVLFLTAFLLVACAFAIVGIVFNNGVSKTFSTSDQNHGIAPLMIAAMNGLQDWVGAILGTVNGIISTVSDASLTNALAGVTAQVGDLNAGSTELSAQANAFGQKYGQPNPAPTGFNDASKLYVLANGTQYHCDGNCLALGTGATAMGTEITTKVNPQFATYTTVINDVEASFLDVTADIVQKLHDATGDLNDAQTQVSKPQDRKTITDNAESAEKVDKQRNTVFLVLFSLVFLSPLITAIGLLTKRSCPFKLSFCLGPFYLFVIWLLFGLHWMLGLTIGDSCVYLDDAMLDLADHLASRSSSGALPSVLNACLTNTSLIVALNLTSQLDFANLIKFPAPLNETDLAATFTFTSFATIQAKVAALDTSNFNFNEAQVIDATISTMNTVGATTAFTRTFVRSCGNSAGCFTGYPAIDQPRLQELQDYAYEGLLIADAINAQILTIRADVNSLNRNITALQSKLNDTIHSIADSSNPNSMQALLQPVLNSVHDFENEAYCYFAAEAFGHFKNTFCDQLQNSIQWMTCALFLIGLSCFGITWCSRWSSYRVAFVHKVAPMPASMFDEGAWMQQNTGSAAGAGYAAGQGVQLAQMGEEGQYTDAGQQGHMVAPPMHDGAYVASNSNGGALPPYAEALAAYNSPAQPSVAEQAAAQEWQATEQLQSPSGADAAMGETGATSSGEAMAAGALAAAATINSPSAAGAGCQSCEKEPASIRCQECEESLCAACDTALHKTEANAGHNRAAI